MNIATVEKTGPSVFKVTLGDGTILWVPEDEQNADYTRVQAWIAAGGVVG